MVTEQRATDGSTDKATIRELYIEEEEEEEAHKKLPPIIRVWISNAENSEGQVEYLDLTIDAFGLPAFDWILSLEVAEHIPSEYER